MSQMITNLKDKARQRFKVQIDNAGIAEFFLYYLPTQQGWYFDLKYGNFEVNGVHLVFSYNILRQYFNILRFGICCDVADGTEPYFINDFSTGRVKLFILYENEINIIEKVAYD